MAAKLDVGDRVRWNSEAGVITGHIVRVRTGDFTFRGRTRRATKDDPQYEVKSDKTGRVAAHKAAALRKAR